MKRSVAARIALTVAALLAHPVRAARADDPPPAALRHRIFSAYEDETIKAVLASAHLERDPSPQGKRIERIEIVPLDVFEKRDILPEWLDIFHTKTLKDVIAREVLLRPGERYDQATIDDTIRNIRRMPGLPQLSAVLVFAAKGADDGGIVLFVVTKDVWSLRLNWGLVGTLGGIDSLTVQPSETNVAGTHQTANALFVLEPSTMTTGAGYMIPRLADSRVALQAYGNVMVNRASGALEGSYGDLVAGAPLFAGTTNWAWDGNVYFQDVVARRYVNAALSDYYDPATKEQMPFEFRAHNYRAAYSLTRSFGWDTNNDITVSAIMNRNAFAVQAPSATVSERTIDDFKSAAVPLSDTQVGPSLQYHTYSMRFVRVVNVETLGLQEDYRIGHDVVARVYPSFTALGASRDFVGTYFAAQYTWAVRDGLFRVALQATTDFERTRISDGAIEPSAHLVSPTVLGTGRFVLDGAAMWRYRNYLNLVDYLGGDDRLRGYPTNFFVGKNVLAYNVEFRTKPLNIFSLEVGAVAFFDIGTATNSASLGQTYQSAGVGIRALFPWLDRTTFRADVGVPFEHPLDPSLGRAIAPISFVISFGQAFGTPTVAPSPGTLATQQVPNPAGGAVLGLPTGQQPDAP